MVRVILIKILTAFCSLGSRLKTKQALPNIFGLIRKDHVIKTNQIDTAVQCNEQQQQQQ